MCLDTSSWNSASSRETPALLISFTSTSLISLSTPEIYEK
jgi:hypothetical protein